MRQLTILVCLILVGCHDNSFDEDTITGEIVVDFADNVDVEYINKIGNELSIQFAPDSNYSSVDKIYIGHYYGDNENKAIKTLQKNSNVEAAEKEILYFIPEHSLPSSSEGLRATTTTIINSDGFPNDPRFNEQWNLKQINLPKNWSDRTGNGNGVIVAVIDTGVSRTADLAETNIIKGYNFVSNTENTDDDNGHGTHVAGTIAQSTNNGIGVAGVAHRSIIMPVKVLSAEGSGTNAGVAEGIRFATDHGAKVINMSLGGFHTSTIIEHAVKYAFDHGVVVVCAAGNSARDKVSYPAAYPGAIAVAATQQDERTTFYSNWGKEIAIAAPGGNTRLAPAGGILQNTVIDGKDDYYYFMGTSMASPHIAGVAAMIVSEGIEDPSVVRNILISTAREPVGMDDKPNDYSDHYGAGLVDAEKAVQKARSSYSSGSQTTTHYIPLFILVVVVLFLLWKNSKKSK